VGYYWIFILVHVHYAMLRSLLWLFAVPLVEILALISMSIGPVTAYSFWTGIVVFALVAKHYHDKHFRSEQYDDRLSFARMDAAREWLIQKGGEKKK
jgi:hypothetical protein